MRREIVAFDFDGTITSKDTLLELLIYFRGHIYFFWKVIVNFPYLALYALRLYPNYKAKERLLSSYFKGMPKRDFESLAERFAKEKYGLIRESAKKEINKHKKENREVIIVTASPVEWVKYFADMLGIQIVIGTELQSDEFGRLTGTFSKPNCFGLEKVRRLQNEYQNRGDYILWAYGDSKGDEQLLEFADYSFYKKLT